MERIQEQLQKIDSEVKRTYVNKGTEYHLGQLRARHARLARELHELQKKQSKATIESIT